MELEERTRYTPVMRLVLNNEESKCLKQIGTSPFFELC